jgi:hypothetical protein
MSANIKAVRIGIINDRPMIRIKKTMIRPNRMTKNFR